MIASLRFKPGTLNFPLLFNSACCYLVMKVADYHKPGEEVESESPGIHILRKTNYLDNTKVADR
jgi:hypothetical protein